jgi:hypothetical protein
MNDGTQMLPPGFKIKPMPGQPQQVKVDLAKATQCTCACGCLYFIQAVTVHIVSALLSPTGQELPVQVPALVCMECKAQLPVGNENK